MIHVILVDDDSIFIECLEKEIKDYFLKHNYAYQIYIFHEYDEEFFKLANTPMENKLYLFDIETENDNGIDVARKIRRYEHDSDILFLTAHDTDEYKNKIVTSNIKSMGFIYKGNLKQDFPNKMEEFLMNVILKDTIAFDDGMYHYALPIRDILYVTTNKLKRKTVVHMISGFVELSLSLHEVEQMLFNKAKFFVKVHRSYTVNVLRMLSFNLTKKSILFSNQEEIIAISRKHKQQLIDAWNRYHATEKESVFN